MTTSEWISNKTLGMEAAHDYITAGSHQSSLGVVRATIDGFVHALDDTRLMDPIRALQIIKNCKQSTRAKEIDAIIGQLHAMGSGFVSLHEILQTFARIGRFNHKTIKTVFDNMLEYMKKITGREFELCADYFRIIRLENISQK